MNEEDGFEFVVSRTIDGESILQANLMGESLDNTSQIQQRLRSHQLSPVFQLRVVAILQMRIKEQLVKLTEAIDNRSEVQNSVKKDNINADASELSFQLCNLERNLLSLCVQHFEQESSNLLQSTVVQDYLNFNQAPSSEDDFA